MVKPIAEKSPNSLTDFTLAFKSWISGTEKFVLRPNTRSALPNVNQAIFVTVYQGPQQDAAHKRKDSRISADAERQG